MFHKTSKAEFLWVKQSGNPGVSHFASSTRPGWPHSAFTELRATWSGKRSHFSPTITHDHDRAKHTLPPLQNLWVKIKRSVCTEPEAQEHDSRPKQQLQRPTRQRSCPVSVLPLRSTVTLSGGRRFLHFLSCPHPISNRRDAVETCGPSFLSTSATTSIAKSKSINLYHFPEVQHNGQVGRLWCLLWTSLGVYAGPANYRMHLDHPFN